MATEIASLVVGIGGDPTGYTRAIRDSIEATKRFRQDFQSQFAAIDLPVNQITQKGNLVGFRLYDSLRDAFNAASRANQEALARGLIDSREFDRRGREAAAALNQGILTGIDQLRTAGALSSELEHELIRSMNPAGIAAGTTLLVSLERTFDARKRQLAEALARGVISPGEFREQGAAAAREFNAALLAEVDRARASVAGISGQLGGGGPFRDARGRFTSRPAASAALVEAQRTAAAIERTYIDALRPVSQAAARAGDNLSAMGRRAAPAITGVAFAFEGMARGAAAGESAVRAAARQVANFGFFFGPQGILIAGVAAGGLAIKEYFDGVEARAKEAAEAIREFNSLLIRGSTDALQATSQDIARQIREATAELDRLSRENRTVVSSAGVGARGMVSETNRAAINEQLRLIADLEAQQARINNMVSLRTQSEWATADALEAQERALAGPREFLELIGRAREALELEPSVAALTRIAELYDEAGRRAERITNATDEHRLALLRVREEMEKIQLLRIMQGAPIIPPAIQTADTSPSDAVLAERLRRLLPAQVTGAPVTAIPAPPLDTTELLRSIAVGSQGLAQLGEAIGFLDDATARAIQGIGSLAGGFAQIGEGGLLNQIAGGLGIAGGIASLVTSIIADSGEAEARAQNTRAIERLTREMTQQGASSFLAVRGVLEQTLAGGFSGSLEDRFREIAEVASDAGVALSDIRAAAEELGVDISNLTAEQLTAFLEILDLTIDGMTRFQNTLADQQRILSLRAEVFDIEATPARQIEENLALLTRFAPELAASFAGIDATTEAGRAQIEAALRALTESLLANAIPPEMFGTLGLDELIEIITGVDTALDDFADGLRDATGALLNVPTGFRIAAAIFGAQMPEVPGMPGAPGGAMPPWPPPVSTHPSGPGGIPTGTPGGAGGGAGGGGAFQPVVTIAAGAFGPRSVVIDARDRSMDEVFDEFVAVLRRKALQLGDEQRVVEALQVA